MAGYPPYNQSQPPQEPDEYQSPYGSPASGYNPPPQEYTASYVHRQYTFVQGYGFMLPTPEDTERTELGRQSRQLGLSLFIYFVLLLCVKPFASTLTLFVLRLFSPNFSADNAVLVTLLWFYPLILLFPFWLFKRSTGIPTRVSLPMRAPRLGIVFSGMLILLGLTAVGMAAMTALSAVLNLIGLYVRQSSMALPKDIGGIVLYIINFVLIASVLEELVFRGLVMQPLRRFGDGFALIVSSLAFALLHTSLLKLPYIFLCGLCFGYFVLRTGSLLAGMALHFTNNLFLVLSDLFTRNLPPRLYTLTQSAMLAMFLLLGIIAAVVLVRKNRGMFTVMPSETVLNERAKLGVMLGSAPMVLICIAVGVMMLTGLALVGGSSW